MPCVFVTLLGKLDIGGFSERVLEPPVSRGAIARVQFVVAGSQAEDERASEIWVFSPPRGGSQCGCEYAVCTRISNYRKGPRCCYPIQQIGGSVSFLRRLRVVLGSHSIVYRAALATRSSSGRKVE